MLVDTVADPRGGGNRRPPPLPNWINCVFNPFFKIIMLKNKAQNARESIKTTLELPGPLSGPCMEPCRKWVRFRARNVRAGT